VMQWTRQARRAHLLVELQLHVQYRSAFCHCVLALANARFSHFSAFCPVAEVTEKIVSTDFKDLSAFLICFVIRVVLETLALPVRVGGFSTHLFLCLRVTEGLTPLEGPRQLLFLF
jgi:hypothetical protein